MPSYSTDQDFLRSLFQEPSHGKDTQSGEKSSPDTPGSSSPATGMKQDSDVLSESELFSLLGLLSILGFLTDLAEEDGREMSEKPGSSAEGKSSGGSSGMPFNAGDRLRVLVETEAVVAYNSDDKAETLYLRPDGHEALFIVPKDIMQATMLQPASEIEYDQGGAYEDACGDVFLRRFNDDDPADSRRWVNEFGEFTKAVCPPLRKMKAA